MGPFQVGAIRLFCLSVLDKVLSIIMLAGRIYYLYNILHIDIYVHMCMYIYLLDLFRWYWDGDISDWAGLLLSRASPHFWFPSNTNRGMWELSTWLAALYTTWKFLSVQHSLNGTVSHSLPNASSICDDDNEWANVPSADYSIFWNFFRHKFSREKVFIMNTLTGATINVYSYNTVRFYSK